MAWQTAGVDQFLQTRNDGVCCLLLLVPCLSPQPFMTPSRGRRWRCCEEPPHNTSSLGTGKGISNKSRKGIRTPLPRSRRIINFPPSPLEFISTRKFWFSFVFVFSTGTGLSYISSQNVCWICIVPFIHIGDGEARTCKWGNHGQGPRSSLRE